MSKHSNKQAGGTVIGLIIGLIVGLAIAVVVALAVTKTSLPFTNKFAKSEKASGTATGEVADPNKPLYGNKAASREAAQSLAKPAPEAPVDNANPPVVDKAAEAKAKAAEKVEAAKAARAKAEDADEKWIYYLQAGAFREAPDAENIKAKLALMGFEATVSERQADTGTLYRVRIGPFGQVEAMNRVRSKLSDNGVDVAVVRVGK